MHEKAQKIENQKLIYTNYGYITHKYNDNLFFKIAKITYEHFLSEEYQFIIEPFYDILNVLKDVDIPGIDLSLKLAMYYRTNFIPVFVSERIIPRNRVNLIEELKRQGFDFYHPFLLLLDSKMEYSGDKLTVKSENFFTLNVKEFVDHNDLNKVIPSIVKNLAARRNISILGIEINDSNREIALNNYLFLYDKIIRNYNNKQKGIRGRKKKEILPYLLKDIRNLQVNEVISLEEAVKRSGLGSKKTYYRRIKELKDKIIEDENK